MSTYPLSKGLVEEILRYLAAHGNVRTFDPATRRDHVYSRYDKSGNGYSVISATDLHINDSDGNGNGSVSARAEVIIHDLGEQVVEATLSSTLPFTKMLQFMSDEGEKVKVIF